MAKYRITSPDGGTYEITAPDDASQEQVLAYAQANHAQAGGGKPAPPSAPSEDNPGGLTSLGAGLGAGVGKAALGAQYYLGAGLDAVGLDSAGQWLKNDSAAGRAKLDSELKPYKDAHKYLAGGGELAGNVLATLPVGGLMGKGLQATGNALRVGSKVAPLAQSIASSGMAPGVGLAARALGGGINGATTAAILDPGNTSSILTGGAIGGAFPVVTGGIARLIRPKAVDNASLQTLRQAGVKPTIGQASGGMLNAIEEKATSIPFVGDAIQNARKGAQEQLNRAAINRAMAPIGESTQNIGRQGLDDAYTALSGAYDDLLPKLRFKADNTFSSEIGNLQKMSQGLEPTSVAQFDKIVRDKVIGKLSPAGGMTGETFKQVEADLGKLAKTYSGSAMAADKQLGGAIAELQSTLRSTLERSNPAHAKRLGEINQGYANYARIRAAAAASGAENGVFTPAQLSQAVRTSDASVGKGKYARGTALMQDLSDAGRAVLGSKVPDSGTAGRLIPTAGLLGAGALDLGATAGLLGAGTLAYSKPVQNGLLAAIAARPESTKAIAKGFKRGASLLAPMAVPAALEVGRTP